MMENKKNNLKLITAGTIAALGASLCCITPVLALLAGVGGVASTFSWLDPFRPYMIVLAVGVLGFAWYQKLKPQKQIISCGCKDDREKKPFIQSKKFLGVVTVLALFLLAFPSYSNALFPEPTKKSAAVIPQADLQQAKLTIRGMTCGGCESSVNHALSSKKGVFEAKASYEEGMAKISFDPTFVSPEILKKAIEEDVGYTVTNIEFIDTNKE